MATVNLSVTAKVSGTEGVVSLGAAMDDTGKRASALDSVIQGMGIGAGISIWETLGSSVMSVGQASIAAAEAFLETSGSLADLSARTSIAIGTLQELEYSGSLVGVSLDQITSAADMMTRKLVDSPKAFGALGLEVDRLIAMDPGEAFKEVAAAIGNIENPAQRASAAVAAFGRGGMALMPLFRSDIMETSAKAHELGAVLGDDLVGAGDRLGDKLTDVTKAWEGFQMQLAGAILQSPDAEKGISDLATGIGNMAALIAENADTFGQFASWLATIAEIGTPGAMAISNAVGMAAGASDRAPRVRTPTDFAGAPGSMNADYARLLAAGLQEANVQLKEYEGNQKKAEAAAKAHADQMTRLRDQWTGGDIEKALRADAEALGTFAAVLELPGSKLQELTDKIQKAADMGLQIPAMLQPLAGATQVSAKAADEAGKAWDGWTDTLETSGHEIAAVLAAMSGLPVAVVRASMGLRALTAEEEEAAAAAVLLAENIARLHAQLGLVGGRGVIGFAEEMDMLVEATEQWTSALGEVDGVLAALGFEDGSLAAAIGNTGAALGQFMAALASGNPAAIVSSIGSLAGAYRDLFDAMGIESRGGRAAVGGALFGLPGALVGFLTGGGVSAATEELNALREGFSELTAEAFAAGIAIDGVAKARDRVTAKAAANEVSLALGRHDKDAKNAEEAQEKLNGAMERYGFTADEMGEAFRRQELDKQAADLLQSFQLLTAAGADQGLVIERMGEDIGAYIAASIAAGGTIPEAMKPIVEAYIQQGKLLDENGVAFESAEDAGITFTQSLSEGLADAVDAIDRLIEGLNAFLGMPSKKTITVETNETTTTGGGGPPIVPKPNDGSFATGVSNFVVPFDNFTANLHKGEVLNVTPAGQASSAGGGGMSTAKLEALLDALPRKIARQMAAQRALSVTRR